MSVIFTVKSVKTRVFDYINNKPNGYYTISNYNKYDVFVCLWWMQTIPDKMQKQVYKCTLHANRVINMISTVHELQNAKQTKVTFHVPLQGGPKRLFIFSKKLRKHFKEMGFRIWTDINTERELTTRFFSELNVTITYVWVNMLCRM